MKYAITRKIIYIFAIYVVIFLSGCQKSNEPKSHVHSRGVSPGQLKSFKDINTFYQQKLTLEDGEYQSGILMEAYISSPQELTPLLGAFAFNGNTSKYNNGSPNATNMYIWKAVFNSLAMRMAGVVNIEDDCQSNNSGYKRIHPDLVKSVEVYCKEPKKENLLPVWQYIIGYEADQEFDEWYALLESKGVKNSKDDFFTIYYSLFFNPYFLIES